MANPQKAPVPEINEGLEVYNNPEDPTVDIVAVPGLGGNAVKSWQKQSKLGSSTFNWIADIRSTDPGEPGNNPAREREIGGLAKDCPNARVLLWNYASAYQGPYKIYQDMTNIVTMLLKQLKSKREGSPRRPIVFIGHSMGGLVIAKALIHAEKEPEEFPDMYEAISGCLFFGTPFNGAPVADIAHQWAEINSRLGRAIDSELLKHLQPGNIALKDLKGDFIRSANKLGHKVQMHCYWERRETPWDQILPKLANLQSFPSDAVLADLNLPENRDFVTKESATLDGVNSTGLPRTHRELVRFESIKDPAYPLVMVPLMEVVNAAPRVARGRYNDTRQSAIDRPTLKRVLKILEGTDYKRILKRIQQRSMSTSWIVTKKVDEYDNWLHSHIGQSGFPTDYLWIHGSEGTGKSSAAAAIVNDIEEHIDKIEERADQSPPLLAYFFCEATPDNCTAEEVIKGLMYQLCEQHDVLANYASQFLRDRSKGEKPELSLENLWQSLEDMLSEATVDTVYLILNNFHKLDHSAPSTAKLYKLIKEDIERTSSGQSNRVRTKWLITSCSHQDMRNILQSEKVREINLNSPEYEEEQRRGLQEYAWTKVEHLQEKKQYTMALKYLACSVIAKRASSTKWIDAAVIQLDALPDASSETRVQGLLERIPQDFQELLELAWLSLLNSIDEDNEIIKELLSTLVLTFEDPGEDELFLLSGLSINDESCRESLQKFLKRCQPLVQTHTLQNGATVVGFVNADIKKHLRDHSHKLLKIPLGDDDHWTKWQHGKMSLRCFEHILSTLENIPEGPKETTTGEVEEGHSKETANNPSAPAESEPSAMIEPDQIKIPVLDYAVRYWLRHASLATPDIAKIISQHHKFWDPESGARALWMKHYADLTRTLTGFKPDSWKALHVVASIGFRGLVVALLEEEQHRGEVHEYDSLENTPLHLAAWFGNVEIVEELLHHSPGSVNDAGTNGMCANPLAMAASAGKIAVMRKLINDWKADVDAIDRKLGPVLNFAIMSGNTQAVSLLLEHDVRVNYDSDDFSSLLPPLALSAYISNLEMFRTILKNAEGRLNPWEFNKALILASAAGNLDILDTVLEYDHDNGTYQSSLNAAVRNTRWDACLKILAHPKAQGLDCDELFERAATGSETTLIELLQACWDNNREAVKGVLDKCLYQAADNEKGPTVRLLLHLGANPDATGDEYGNALTAAAHDGTAGIMSLLLESGANVNSPDGYALQEASSQGHTILVEMLLDKGADVNQLNDRDKCRTALQAACNSGHLDVAKLLLSRGANPNLGGGAYTRPIFGAIYFNHVKILHELLKSPELELNIVGAPMRSTPLTASVIILPAEHMGPLIDHGAEVDFADAEGHTALMVAAMMGDEDCLRFLLERGADFLKADNENHTALQMAIGTRNSNLGCMKLLLARADFMLQRLGVAAARGDKDAQTLIDEEKSCRGEAMEKEAAEAAARQKERDALQKPADEGETGGLEEPGNPEATSVENVEPVNKDHQIESGTQDIPNQHLSSNDVVNNDVVNPDEAGSRLESKQAPEPTLTSYPTPYSTPEAGDEGGDKEGKARTTSPGAEQRVT